MLVSGWIRQCNPYISKVDKHETPNYVLQIVIMQHQIQNEARWSNPQLGQLAGDLAAAAASASLVTPAVAIIDRFVSTIVSAKIPR